MDCNCDGGHKLLGIVFLIMNLVLIGMGIGLIVVGILAKIEASIIETDNVKPLLDPILYDTLQAGSVAFGLSVLIIIIGALVLVITVLGLVPIISGKIRRLLLVYAIIIGAAGLSQAIFMAMWVPLVRYKVEGDLKENLIATLNENFIEDTMSHIDPISNAWNFMFIELDCCGVNPVASTRNDFDSTPWCATSGSCQTGSSQIPRTCCIGVDENMYSSAPMSCHGNVTSGTYNAKGCYDVLKEKLLSQSPGYIGVVSTLYFIEIICLILSIVIYKTDKLEETSCWWIFRICR